MDVSKTLLRIRGFGDINFHGDTQKGDKTAFTLGQLNLFVTSDISDKFKFLGEIVFEAGPDNIYGRTRGESNAFGVDVDGMAPGQEIVIDETAFGFPVRSIKDVPPGEYYVQALINRYETFNLKSGKTVKLPPDQGEGQHHDDHGRGSQHEPDGGADRIDRGEQEHDQRGDGAERDDHPERCTNLADPPRKRRNERLRRRWRRGVLHLSRVAVPRDPSLSS